MWFPFPPALSAHPVSSVSWTELEWSLLTFEIVSYGGFREKQNKGSISSSLSAPREISKGCQAEMSTFLLFNLLIRIMTIFPLIKYSAWLFSLADSSCCLQAPDSDSAMHDWDAHCQLPDSSDQICAIKDKLQRITFSLIVLEWLNLKRTRFPTVLLT